MGTLKYKISPTATKRSTKDNMKQNVILFYLLFFNRACLYSSLLILSTYFSLYIDALSALKYYFLNI